MEKQNNDSSGLAAILLIVCVGLGLYSLNLRSRYNNLLEEPPYEDCFVEAKEHLDLVYQSIHMARENFATGEFYDGVSYLNNSLEYEDVLYDCD